MSRLICFAQGSCPRGSAPSLNGEPQTAHVRRRDGQAVFRRPPSARVPVMFLSPSPRRYFTMEATSSAFRQAAQRAKAGDASAAIAVQGL
ncbi:hypothetical protein BJA5080_03407 [Bradyrhizobium diazoefficiens SEMIA 5080]|uniref:Uncharacterized protein n=1 Tax=Bradyrhizobium diazoefficiens SEMIA 5080 TaxID=754504 RepID=A0A837CCQ3_9BRAD|nr:hypothetical protein BJA5080_03407 [Bradyrhizobium diazoefficiens SEMIA 5080]